MSISDNTKALLIRVTLFTTYVLVGAAIFREIERKEQHREVERIRKTRMEILRKYNITRSDAKRWAETFAAASLSDEDYLEWNYGNSVLFAVVILTTIGYGNIVPRTDLGRLFLVAYAFVGIPGTCLTLKTMGDKITDTVTYLFITFEQRLLKRPHPQKVKLKVALGTVTLTLALVLPLVALAIKLRHEGWSYIECFYFTFVTLSTIGFGDYLPQFEKNADFLFLILALIGLSCVSSIFCSMNNFIEQYGMTARMTRSLRGKDAGNSANKPLHDATTRGTNGVMDTSLTTEKAEDFHSRFLESNERAHGATNSRRNSFNEEMTAESKKHGATISLGVFTC